MSRTDGGIMDLSATVKNTPINLLYCNDCLPLSLYESLHSMFTTSFRFQPFHFLCFTRSCALVSLCLSITQGFRLSNMPAAADRLSKLPDNLLGLIVSTISIREAVKCSILSHRWRYVYTQIRELKLSPLLLLGERISLPQIEKVEKIISNILLLHSPHLEAFHLSTEGGTSDWQFTGESLCKWVRYLALKNVQSLTLLGNRGTGKASLFPIFSCILSHNIPTHFPGFNHLVTCCFSYVEFTDDSLARFISHCPLLKRFTISNSSGLQKTVISAINITHLKVSDNDGMEVLIVICPKLIHLELGVIKDLTVNGISFHEISSMVYELDMHRGNNLIGLQLEWRGILYNFSAERFLEILGSLGTLESLKQLTICICQLFEREREKMVVPLYKLFERLSNLERLLIQGVFLTELGRDDIPPSLSSPLTKLRIVQVDIDDFDYRIITEREIALLGCLLQSAPALEIIEFGLSSQEVSEFDSMSYIGFLEKMLNLRRASAQARICKGITSTCSFK